MYDCKILNLNVSKLLIKKRTVNVFFSGPLNMHKNGEFLMM